MRRQSCGSTARRRSSRPAPEALESRALLAAPTAAEQEFLEWTNRVRLDPAGEFDRLIRTTSPISSDIPGVAIALGVFNVDLTQLRNELLALVPVAPLAWSSALNDAARGHNLAMILADEQSHQLPGEGDLGARANAAGYTGWSALGENIFAYGQSVAHAHAGFVIDWGDGTFGMQDPRGHRINIMSAGYREVGIAVTSESNPSTEVGPLVVTQDFGSRFAQTEPFLLGVVYADNFDNDFYNAGEGLGGVTVTAVGTGGTYTTTTWASGGYQMQMAPGSYTVTFSGAGLSSPRSQQIFVGDENIKIDVDVLAPDPSTSFVRFASTVGNVTEGESMDLVVVRSGNLSDEAIFQLTRVATSSASDQDFELVTNGGLLTFAPGQSVLEVRLNTLDDLDIEGVESLVIAIQPLLGATVVTNSRMTLFVADNDAPRVEPVSIVSAQAVRAGKATKSILIQFAGDVDARSATKASAYFLRRAGRDRRFLTRDDVRLPVARVRYDAQSKTATLILKAPMRRRENVLLNLRAAVIRDLADRPPVGNLSVVIAVG